MLGRKPKGWHACGMVNNLTRPTAETISYATIVVCICNASGSTYTYLMSCGGHWAPLELGGMMTSISTWMTFTMLYWVKTHQYVRRGLITVGQMKH